MPCEYCGQYITHHPRCPLYIPSKATHHCSACGERIYDGEEYIENDKGEFRHYECFYGMKELLEWLGYDIKTMDDYE